VNVVRRLPASLLAAFLVLPLLALLISSLRGGHWPWTQLVRPLLATTITTIISTSVAVGCGTPLAWMLAQANSLPARIMTGVVQLSVVMPPAVAGVSLVLAFGDESPWTSLGLPSLAHSNLAVVMAQVLVAAPLYVQAAIGAFSRLDVTTVGMARTLGASPTQLLWLVAVPMALPSLLAGMGLCWARALGEFGATVAFAGRVDGVAETLPLAIYTLLERDPPAARAMAVLLLVEALLGLVLLRSLARRSET
jgi:molybdate transport system permease protein